MAEQGKKAKGVPISEPSTRIKRSMAASNSKGISEPPPTSSVKVDNNNNNMGKAKVARGTISDHSTRRIITGAKEPIPSEPSKDANTVKKGKAKEVIIPAPKPTNKAGTQVEKGKKAEVSQKTTAPPIRKPSETKEKGRKPLAHHDRPVYRIVWDVNFNEASESPSQACPICELDLCSSGPGSERGEREDEYDYYFKRVDFPEVGVLGCGHAYHAQCLEAITPEDLLTEPPCLLCLSGSVD